MATGARSTARPSDQPLATRSLISGALHFGKEALVLARGLARVLYDLQPLEDAFGEHVAWQVLERVVDHPQRRRVRGVVVGVVRELGPGLRPQDVVYELVGILRVLGARS